MNTFKKLFDIKLLFISLFSAFISSFVIVNLIIPCGLYSAGFSGICRITTDLFRDYLNIHVEYAILYFILNLIACIFTFKYIGKKFTIYSVIQFTASSLFCYFLKPIVVIDDILLFIIFGGIINGISSGLCLRFDFSTGGIDFISVYYSTKKNKSFWNYAFCINSVILLIAGLIYGYKICMYSIIYQFVNTEMVKQMHNRFTYKTLTIITKKPEEVSTEIMKHVRHGITEIKTEGFYSKTESTMLYTVVNSFQYRTIMRIVKSVDPHAFINVQDTKELQGNYYQKPLD